MPLIYQAQFLGLNIQLKCVNIWIKTNMFSFIEVVWMDEELVLKTSRAYGLEGSIPFASSINHLVWKMIETSL